MNRKLLLCAAVLALAAPALRAEDDEAEEAPAAEQATEAAPVPAAAPAAEGQSLGGAGLRRQKSHKPGQRKIAPAESAGEGGSDAKDDEESEEPVRRRQETRTPVTGGGSGAGGGGTSGGPAPAGMRVYESLDYPNYTSIPHKGAHPHFTFSAVGEGVAIRFTGTAAGLWQVTPGSDGQDCNARLWISSGPGGRPVGADCDQPSPPGAPAQNILALDFVSKKPGSACLLRSGQSYYVNMTVSSKWGHCSLYLDPNGSVR